MIAQLKLASRELETLIFVSHSSRIANRTNGERPGASRYKQFHNHSRSGQGLDISLDIDLKEGKGHSSPQGDASAT
ncbi:hypothetical protein RRG08_025856 [Elysia crispata]|uniref:Uncharacterized protein n=1 Tax=Elysia crispata TaxID=231223 RepID=A0AAE0Y436_9GAST|nr:hypothetical protein RRG08_025856 [Elysia crispata]